MKRHSQPAGLMRSKNRKATICRAVMKKKKKKKSRQTRLTVNQEKFPPGKRST